MKRLLISLLALFSTGALNAQFIVGWSGGWAPSRELNREIYVYNLLNGPNLKKEMGEVHWYQGVVAGFTTPGEGKFVELLYNRKRCLVTSEFDSAGVPMQRQLKVLCNTWNLGIGFRSDGWTVGLSWDFGRFKGKGRRGPESGIGDLPFDRLWVLDKTRLLGIAAARLFCQETIFVQRDFGPVGVRAFVQIAGTYNDMDGLDAWLFGGDLNYAVAQRQGFANFGVAVTVKVGKQ